MLNQPEIVLVASYVIIAEHVFISTMRSLYERKPTQKEAQEFRVFAVNKAFGKISDQTVSTIGETPDEAQMIYDWIGYHVRRELQITKRRTKGNKSAALSRAFRYWLCHDPKLMHPLSRSRRDLTAEQYLARYVKLTKKLFEDVYRRHVGRKPSGNEKHAFLLDTIDESLKIFATDDRLPTYSSQSERQAFKDAIWLEYKSIKTQKKREKKLRKRVHVLDSLDAGTVHAADVMPSQQSLPIELGDPRDTKKSRKRKHKKIVAPHTTIQLKLLLPH